MIQRCTNKKHLSYKNYGALGISVCDEWMASFEKFLANMGPRPKGFSIERGDPKGDYCKENCSWLPLREQAWNRKNSVRVVVNGRNLRVPELSADTGIPETTLYRWLRSGVDIDHLISQRAAKPGASIRHQQSAG